MKNMRILIPARQSQNRKGRTTGYDTQDQDTRSWCERNDHTVVAVVADKISGRISPFDRPNLGPWLTRPELIAQYDAIAVSKLDRLSRGRDWNIRQWVIDHGKKLFVVSPELCWPPEPGDTATPIVWDTLVNIASTEWDNTSKRYRRMLTHLIDNGYLTGVRTFGLQIVGANCGESNCEHKDEHKTFALHPEESECVKIAVARYIAGASLREQCDWLNEQMPPRHSDVWHPSTLGKLFRNSSLMGRRVNAEGNTIMRHVAILDMDTWQKLQAEMDRRAQRSGVVSSNTAMLTNIVSCSCGNPMYRQSTYYERKNGTRSYRTYYRCKSKDNRTLSKCRNSIALAWLDEWVESKLRHPVHGIGLLKIEEVVVIPGQNHDNEIADVERDIRELDMDADDYLGQVAGLRAERSRLKELPAEADQVIKRERDETILERWITLDTAGKRDLLVKLGITICIDPPQVKGEDPVVRIHMDSLDERIEVMLHKLMALAA
jgi:hypothetical protein